MVILNAWKLNMRLWQKVGDVVEVLNIGYNMLKYGENDDTQCFNIYISITIYPFAIFCLVLQQNMDYTLLKSQWFTSIHLYTASCVLIAILGQPVCKDITCIQWDFMSSCSSC